MHIPLIALTVDDVVDRYIHLVKKYILSYIPLLWHEPHKMYFLEAVKRGAFSFKCLVGNMAAQEDLSISFASNFL